MRPLRGKHCRYTKIRNKRPRDRLGRRDKRNSSDRADRQNWLKHQCHERRAGSNCIPPPIAPIGEVVLNRVSSASSTFYVASNTAFNIDAELEASETFPAATRASTSFELSVDRQGHGPLSFGSHAQLPHSQGAHAGIAADVKTLNDITSRRTIFTGDQRTAARPGSIAEQSVRFTTHLENSAASQANVLLTVYVP